MYKVIVADDEIIVQKALSKLIPWESLDCELVLLASDGQTVLDKIEELKPDILILDIKMPGATGLEIAKYIYDNNLCCKVILLTAHSEFSYARNAIQYNVVDYIVKTGSLELLESAIEKAKERLKKEQANKCGLSLLEQQEKFIRMFCSEAIYEESQIVRYSKELQWDEEMPYLVLVIYFQPRNIIANDQHERVANSILNFLKMEFTEYENIKISLRKNTCLVILKNVKENYQQKIESYCRDIIDMTDNFMQMNTYIGISDRVTGLAKLKKEYDKAEYAVKNNFFSHQSDFSFYKKREKYEKNMLKETENLKNELFFYLRNGKEEESLNTFYEILHIQKENKEDVNAILNTGVRIRHYCENILIEYDTNVYDITDYEESITNMINQCVVSTEYVAIIENIIRTVSQYIGKMKKKRSSLIYNCEKYIEENYMKNINVADIAKAIGTNPSYLSRIYKESTGQTIIFVLNQKKIDMAEKYLKNTDKRIFEIAYELGFEDTTYFSRVFKKYTNMSPKQFRNRVDSN